MLNLKKLKAIDMIVKEDSNITIHYTCETILSYEGEDITEPSVFENTYERNEPLSFNMKDEKVFKFFRENLIGKEKGEIVNINVNPEDMYGEVKDDSTFKIPKSEIPENVDTEIGSFLLTKTESGKEITMRIINEIEGDLIVDLNHPLAGKKLTYKVEIIEIN